MRDGGAFRPLTEADRKEISAWRYPGEYAVYNLPPMEEARRARRGLFNPESRFFGWVEDGGLAGYVNLRKTEEAVLLGIGVRPDRCGQGLGRRMLRQAVMLCEGLYPGLPPALEVRAWNLRAIRCYKAAGFHAVGGPFRKTAPGGEDSFVRMEINADQEERTP